MPWEAAASSGRLSLAREVDMDHFFSELVAMLSRRVSAVTPLGTFYVQTFPAYEGRNPRTGEVTKVPPASTTFYVPSDAFSELALGPRRGVTEAELLADILVESTPDQLAPSERLSATEAEVADFAARLSDEPFEVAGLGTFRYRALLADPEKRGIHFRACDALRDALKHH